MPRATSREFDAADLALDAAGAEQIFAQSSVTLTADAASEVARRTEGWPVGVHLAALIAADGHDDGVAITGDDRYIADYLYREALSTLPEEDQRFLRRTAVLDQLSGPLCDAVVGEPGSQARLQHLEASNLFLVPLDRRRQWYRYHGLFREFLMSELSRVEPDTVTGLHRRAAGWYEANGSSAMAIEHLLLAEERERCVQLVSRLFLPTFLAGQLSTVERWLSALGATAIEGCPPLAVLATWMAVYSGATAAAERWAAFVDDASSDVAQPDGSASFESARAMLRAAMCPDGPERMLADARTAVDQEPSWSPWRDTALNMYAEAHLLNGDTERAVTLFGEGVAASARLSSTDPRVVGESELALLAMLRDQWDEAGRRVDVALAIVDQHRLSDYPTAALAFAAAARLAIHRGSRDLADRHLAAAMRVRPLLTFLLPFAAVRVRLQLAMAYMAIADHSAAHHLVREIDDILTVRPALGSLVDEVEALRASLVTTSLLGTNAVSPLTPAELRLLPYLQTHLTAGDIADRLFVSINTINSQLASIYRKLGVSSRRDAVRVGDSGRTPRRMSRFRRRPARTPRRCHTPTPTPTSVPRPRHEAGR